MITVSQDFQKLVQLRIGKKLENSTKRRYIATLSCRTVSDSEEKITAKFNPEKISHGSRTQESWKMSENPKLIKIGK